MNYSLVLAGLAALFFLLLAAAIQLGRWLGNRQHPEDATQAGRPGVAAIEALVFALLGLLVAFTFSGAAQRMAERRALLVQEVNAIGTAWLRIDMVYQEDRPVLREQFRRYVDERIDYYRHVADLDRRDAIAARVAAIQKEIWSTSMQAAQRSIPAFAASYIGAVNEMFDASTAQTVAQKVHPPLLAYVFLCLLALVCACFVGMNLAQGGQAGVLHQIMYALVMTAALYIIVDFEFPRIGAIRIDQSDTLLMAQRDAMVDPSGAAR